MSQQIDTLLVQQFNANVMMLAQQKESRLARAVRQETLTGEYGFFDQYGAVEAQEIVSRHADTMQTEVPYARRRVGGQDWGLGDVIDKQDTAKMLGDPLSAVVRAFAMAMNRRRDRSIVQAMFATAFTGKSGATSVAFPSGQQIAVDYVESGTATNSSLTIGKLRRARELLMDAEVGEDDEAELYIACTQREINALLRTTEVSSSEYNAEVKALSDGRVRRFMGFEFIRLRSALLDLDGSSHRRIPVWHRDGLLREPERTRNQRGAGPDEELQHARFHGGQLRRDPHGGSAGGGDQGIDFGILREG